MSSIILKLKTNKIHFAFLKLPIFCDIKYKLNPYLSRCQTFVSGYVSLLIHVYICQFFFYTWLSVLVFLHLVIYISFLYLAIYVGLFTPGYLCQFHYTWLPLSVFSPVSFSLFSYLTFSVFSQLSTSVSFFTPVYLCQSFTPGKLDQPFPICLSVLLFPYLS